MVKNFLAVFFCGGVGSMLRYGVQLLLNERILFGRFPWATFTVNIVGCFLIGLFYALTAKFNIHESVRLLLTAGLCGGFTTFSTFSNDSVSLLRQGDALLCIAYIGLSVLFGIAACILGASLFK